MNDDRPRIEARTVTAGTIVVRVAGDICGQGGIRFRRTLVGELTGRPQVLILDLTQITRIDTGGINTLCLAAELTAEEDIGLCLVAPAQGAARAGLEAAKSTDTFEIFSSVTEALRLCS
ncbi:MULTISPECIES: STAS domain-containing protein [Mycolicibacterium]|uniref:STAS domain protein n=1 Tax=Mycolicibacterium chlorophenolicum TaxID=37916 RepID=A0A0J6VUS5_9MYCO|nr:STAS domain-containing protein [Mycolicibacterium chlorophenolicum]KMO74760.1 STAS domain protein [Mycolicibacterium chlorophenolicum]